MMSDMIHVMSFLSNTNMLYLQVSWQQLSESTCLPEARSPLLGPTALSLSSPPPPSHPLILLPVIATALKQTETIASEWISTSWIWPHGDSGNFPPRWVTPLQLPCNIYPDKQKARCAQEWLRGSDGQTDGWMERERERESEGREDAAGIEGWIWREVCVCVCVCGGGWGWSDGGRKSQCNKSPLIRACLYHCAAPMRRGSRWEEGTEGQEESRTQIRILIAMIITVCHPMRTFHTCGKGRWVG